MSIMDLSRAKWLKSSYSNQNGGNCVEFTPEFSALNVVPIRDSKDQNGPVLAFSSAAWQEFVTAAASGEFGTVRG